jgi:hypothetical protein
MEDYEPKGASSPEEKAAFQRIYTTAANKGMNVGSVRAYVCAPDGDPLVIAGGGTAKDLEILKDVVKKLGTREGKPVVPPRPQFAAPKTEPTALALHLTARNLPIVEGGEGWGALPGEDWIVYSQREWTKFLPAAGSTPGTTWEIDRDIAIKLLSHFYPAVEEYGFIKKGEYEQAAIKATLVSKNRVRLDASLRMKECFYSDKVWIGVNATAVGVVDFDPAKRTIKRCLMATEKATCGGAFAVVVRSADMLKRGEGQ